MRYGLALLGVIAAFTAITLAAYLKVFSGAKHVTLVVPAAGLQLDRRADVKLHGVVVGEVSEVRPDTGGARLTLALDHDVDRASTAELLPKSLFGEKYVNLLPPSAPRGPIRDGDVITASATAVEVTQVLDRLLPRLRAVRPDRLNSVMNALATALDGRGERLGATFERADAYLAALRPHLPAVRRDLAKLADVTAAYGEAAPDLLRTLDNAAALGRTITDADLARLAETGTRAATRTGRLLAENETGIIGLQHVVRPALDVTARHSPAIPCVFQGLVRLRPRLDDAFGHGRAKAVLEIVRPARPYRPGVDAPAYADRRGPRCYGLPRPPVPFPGVRFADGTRDLAGLMLR
ncbi:MCE family protein [Nonomuraea sp. MG754425]|uniref:MCE family protein n=1 Tax=Nonomuraea sp. MG754425 TaxID=2570319 RepID=UPI001F235211|nr:MCE family protein [Nonomuraea sp. MG754425]MCF6476024.1 MCE family protein [Nonomuraea sp. MG754425]